MSLSQDLPAPEPAREDSVDLARQRRDAELGLPPVPIAPDQFLNLSSADLTSCNRIVEIGIVKWRRLLQVTCAGGQLLQFRIALGRRPLGRKWTAGDLRTPEGVYRIAKPPRSSIYRVFMLLDYPSMEDADRAFAAGRIGPETYDRIRSAIARGDLPPQDTPLGGSIGIHGEGDQHTGRSENEDWTLGCIALSDETIQFLADRVAVGTPVWIGP